MLRLFVLISLLFSTIGCSKTIDEIAKEEGWTFSYGDNTIRATGLVKPKDWEKGLPWVSFKDDPQVIPETYDLRPKLTQIEDQKNCGSCWSFSLTATMRDVLALTNQDPGRLSQQYLVSCAKEQYGCNGGFFDAANHFVAPEGAPSWNSYPYTASDSACKKVPAVASIVSWAYVGSETQSPSADEVKKAILKYGPVSVTVTADNTFSSYKSGIFNACRNGQTNHMTNIVGWGKDYWIMRNSWGTGWGENGYMRIAIVGKNGKRCNDIAETVAFMKVKDLPPPPVVDEFTLTTDKATVHGKMTKGNESKLDTLKNWVKEALDKL